MAPPKGHKFSVGNSGGGRSPEFDWDKEFDDLLVWVDKNKSELIISRFAESKEYSFHSLESQAIRNPDKFRIRLQKAKEIIGARREQRYLNKYSASPYERFATYYSESLHEFEREDKKFDTKMKAESLISSIPPNDQTIHETLQKSNDNARIAQEYARLKATYEPETGIEHFPSQETP